MIILFSFNENTIIIGLLLFYVDFDIIKISKFIKREVSEEYKTEIKALEQ
jgi:hypothetical protein